MNATPCARKLTIAETFTDNKLPVRMFHLHMLLEVRQFVYSLLRERHQEHIERHAGHSVVLCLYIRVLALVSLLVSLIFAFLEFTGIG